MRKTIFLFSILILAVLSPSLAAEDNKPTVAVWDLELGEKVDSAARIPLSDMLHNQLWQTNKYQMVDRSSIGKILEEQEFQQTECVSNECIVEVGQLLGVQKMVSGRLGLVGRKYFLSIKLINVESGRIEKIAAAECTCEIEELTSAIDEAVTKLVGARQRISPQPREAGTPQAVGTGNLSINTTPAGAKVYLDARERGTTPLTLEGVPAGSHTITLLKNGYNIITEHVEVKADQTIEMAKSLSIQTGEIQIDTLPRGTKIFLDGNYVGESPYKIVGVPVGRHKIELRYTDDYYDDSTGVEVGYAETVKVTKNLKGKPSRILVVSTPEKAKVYIDGSYKGETPYEGELEPKAHKIVVKKEGYSDGEQSVDLRPNGFETVTVTLAKKEENISSKKPKPRITKGKDVTAIVETNMGTFSIQFYPDKAPQTVANFIKLASKGFYDGLIFHRVIDGFMIQGGDPTGTGRGGPGYTIKAEFNEHKHVAGTISMARSADPDSAGSQFFVCVAASPHLDGKYTAFGQVVDGLDVVLAISKVKTNRHDRPLEEVVMKKVTIEEASTEGRTKLTPKQIAGRTYVGVASCKMCHKKDEKGNQYKVWEKSKHSRAYRILTSDKAKEIAAGKGIADPQKSPECLKCHVTGYGTDPTLLDRKYRIEDGVGCESCHGPGKQYKNMKIMKDLSKAKANGLIIPTEEVCTSCHNSSSPTFKGFEFDTMYRQIAHPNPSKR